MPRLGNFNLNTILEGSVKFLFRMFLCLVFLLAGVVLAVPYLIDMNSYRKEIQSSLHSMSGLPLMLRGNIELELLPLPAIVLSDMSLDAKAKGPFEALTVSSMVVELDIMPLVQEQKLVPKVITVHSPKVRYNLSHGGLKSLLQKSATIPSGTSFKGAIVTLVGDDKLHIPIKYINATYVHRAGKEQTIQGNLYNGALNMADFHLSTGEGRSEFLLKGAGVDLQVTQRKMSNRHDGDIKVSGQSIDQLTTLLQYIFPASPRFYTPDAFTLSAKYTIDATQLNVRDVVVSSPAVNGTGRFSMLLREMPMVDVAASIKDINLDRFLLQNHHDNSSSGFRVHEQVRVSHFASRWNVILPRNVNGLLYLKADAVRLNNHVIHDVAINTELFNGDLTLHPTSLVLPGKTRMNLQGNIMHNGLRPEFVGNISLEGNHFRQFMQWFDPKNLVVNQENADSLEPFSAEANLGITPKEIRMLNVDVKSPSFVLEGKSIIKYGGALPKIRVWSDVHKLNLDHLVKPFVVQNMLHGIFFKRQDVGSHSLGWLRRFQSQLSLEIRAKNITLNDYTVSRLQTNMHLSQGKLQFRKTSIRSPWVKGAISYYLNVRSLRPFIQMKVVSEHFDTRIAEIFKNNKTLTVESSSAEQGKKNHWWSSKPYDFEFLAPYNGKILLQFKELKHGDISLSDVALKAKLKEEQAILDLLDVHAFKGRMQVQGKHVYDQKKYLISQLVLTGMELEPFFTYMGANTPDKKLVTSGLVQALVSESINTRGATPQEWISYLRGSATLQTYSLTLPGANLHALINATFNPSEYKGRTFQHLIEKSSDSGQTSFYNFSADLEIKKPPFIMVKKGVFSTRRSVGSISGVMSLANWETKVKGMLDFYPPPLSESLAPRLKMSFALSGIPHQDVSFQVNAKQLEDYIRKAVRYERQKNADQTEKKRR